MLACAMPPYAASGCRRSAAARPAPVAAVPAAVAARSADVQARSAALRFADNAGGTPPVNAGGGP